MTFTFEIDDSELIEYGGWEDEDTPVDFKELLKKKVIETIADKIYRTTRSDCSATYNLAINKILKEHTDEIISKVVEEVANKVAKKKQIMEMTPKASEIAAIDKDNEAYFMELMDKAIAKRFK